METTPLVSVVMTTYNHEPYLAEAIESVLAQQTTFSVELLLGEDCSTDSTAAICHAYAEKYPDRVRIVTSEYNVGWRANYRRTIAACRGKYIALCDGDDWWCDPRKLQMQADLLESDPACGMCYTRTQRFYQPTGEYKPFPPECYETLDRMVFSNPVDNCCALARRDLIEQYYAAIRPDQHPEWKTDDQPMWLWFAATSKIRCIDAVTAVHRVLTDSVSHSARYRERIAFVDSILGIGLWFDTRYGGGRNRFGLHRKRASDALWVLSYHGSVSEYLARWWREVKTCPRLLLCPEGAGLFAKKILFRRSKQPKI